MLSMILTTPYATIWLPTKQVDGKPVDETYDKRRPINWTAIQYLIARLTTVVELLMISIEDLCKYMPNKSSMTISSHLRDGDQPYGTDELNYYYSTDEQNPKPRTQKQ